MSGRSRLSSALLVLGFVACTLNPQPLPPDAPGATDDDDGRDAGFGAAVDAAAPAAPEAADGGAADDGGLADDDGGSGDAGDAGDGG